MRRSSKRKFPFFWLGLLALGGIFFLLKNFDVPVEKVVKEIPYSKLQKK